MQSIDSSWEHSAKWYTQLIGSNKSYYHTQLILPKLQQRLDKITSVLDLGCGSGVLLSILSKKIRYVGLDLSPSLLQVARRQCKGKDQIVQRADICNFHLKQGAFDAAVCLLTIQNIKHPLAVFQNAAKHLRKNAHLYLVMMHPCFRIPRQSHWGIDEAKKLQYRRIDAYKTDLDIPISVHPSQRESVQLLHTHRSLESYISYLKQAGFVIADLEEWISPKKSTGPVAKMENRARKEIPLFLFLDAQYV